MANILTLDHPGAHRHMSATSVPAPDVLVSRPRVATGGDQQRVEELRREDQHPTIRTPRVAYADPIGGQHGDLDAVPVGVAGSCLAPSWLVRLLPWLVRLL